MNNPIAFLLGAGASFPYSVPTMDGFYTAFKEHLQRRHRTHFALLSQFESSNRHPSYDLETLLSDLQLAASASDSLALLGVPSASVPLRTTELAELRAYLDAFIIDTCERFDRQSAGDLSAMLALRQLGALWIFTTNYDRIVEYACEHANVEYSDGFEAIDGNPVADWTGNFDAGLRVVKLHGSVNWYRDNPGDGLHRLDRGYSLPTKDFALVRDDQRLTPLMIIPTLEKQVLERPHAQLAVRFTDVLRDLPLLIIAGNSLRDKHLLNYVADRMPRLQVLMISPHASDNIRRLNWDGKAQAADVGFKEFLLTSTGALQRLGQTLQGALNPDEVRHAVSAFVTEVSANVELDSMMKANPELERYRRLLESNNIAHRAQATEALATIAHPSVVERLATVMRDDRSEFVRTSAVSALIRIGSPAAIRAVENAFADVSISVQLEAMAGLISLEGNLVATEVRDRVRTGLSGPAQKLDADDLRASAST